MKARAGECHLFHERPSYNDCFLKLTCVLNVSEALNRLGILYFHRLMPVSFSVRYLGMRRRWLHLLLDELIFVTPFEHSSEAISKTRILLQSQMYLATTSSIESLLFYRLKEEWPQIHSFGGLFEQLQVAHFLGEQFLPRFHSRSSSNPNSILGPWVAVNYTRALAKKASWILGRHRNETNPLRNTFSAVQAVDQIRWAISEGNVTDFVSHPLVCIHVDAHFNLQYSRVREFLICVERAEDSNLTNFHGVMAVLELVTTYIVRPI